MEELAVKFLRLLEAVSFLGFPCENRKEVFGFLSFWYGDCLVFEVP